MFVILLLACVLTALPSALTSCGPISDVTLTFYGWPDNSPPGSDIAFDCGRGKNPDGNPMAGGSGTYDDPISFATATDNKNLPRCAIVYVPLLRKYFRNEDDCAQCLTDWDSKGEYHIDLWTGSNTAGGGQNQIDCEDSLPGGSQTIILDPPNSLPVDTTPLYDQPSNQCHETTYSIPDSLSLCAGGSGGSGGSGSPASISPTPSNTPETFPTLSATSYASSVYQPNPTGTGYTLSTLSTVSSATSPSASASTSCTWKGHCLGDPCRTFNDCFGSDVCTNGVCAICTGGPWC